MKDPHIITPLNTAMKMFMLMLNIRDLFSSFCYGNVPPFVLYFANVTGIN